MKKTIKKTVIIYAVCMAFAFAAGAHAAPAATENAYIGYEDSAIGSEKVCLGGVPFGIKLYSGDLTVVGFTAVDTAEGRKNPAYDAGIRENDIIVSVNGTKVSSAEELMKICNSSEGNEIAVVCRRGKTERTFTLKPALSDDDGKYKTGMWVKDSTSGIGTLTYVVPETMTFAGLGHCVCNARTGEAENVVAGVVSAVEITGVEKGYEGDPGELVGKFTGGKIGTLTANTDEGVFGVFSELPPHVDGEELVPVVPCGKEGEAYIRCTLRDNEPDLYSINITSVEEGEETHKNYTIEVTDERLLAETGGIVQGMSGSPIIQEGNLIGAVTHVFVNDPTKGFGISIENMFDGMPRKAA